MSVISTVKSMTKTRKSGSLSSLVDAACNFLHGRFSPDEPQEYSKAFVRVMFTRSADDFQHPVYHAAKAGRCQMVRFYLGLLVIYHVTPSAADAIHSADSHTLLDWIKFIAPLKIITRSDLEAYAGVSSSNQVDKVLHHETYKFHEIAELCMKIVGPYSTLGMYMKQVCLAVEGDPNALKSISCIESMRKLKKSTTATATGSASAKPPRAHSVFSRRLRRPQLRLDDYYADLNPDDFDDGGWFQDDESVVDQKFETDVDDVVCDGEIYCSQFDKRELTTLPATIHRETRPLSLHPPLQDSILVEQPWKVEIKSDADISMADWEVLSTTPSIESISSDMLFSYKDALVLGEISVQPASTEASSDVSFPKEDRTVQEEVKSEHLEELEPFDAVFIRNGVKLVRGGRSAHIVDGDRR